MLAEGAAPVPRRPLAARAHRLVEPFGLEARDLLDLLLRRRQRLLGGPGRLVLARGQRLDRLAVRRDEPHRTIARQPRLVGLLLLADGQGEAALLVEAAGGHGAVGQLVARPAAPLGRLLDELARVGLHALLLEARMGGDDDLQRGGLAGAGQHVEHRLGLVGALAVLLEVGLGAARQPGRIGAHGKAQEALVGGGGRHVLAQEMLARGGDVPLVLGRAGFRLVVGRDLRARPLVGLGEGHARRVAADEGVQHEQAQPVAAGRVEQVEPEVEQRVAAGLLELVGERQPPAHHLGIEHRAVRKGELRHGLGEQPVELVALELAEARAGLLEQRLGAQHGGQVLAEPREGGEDRGARDLRLLRLQPGPERRPGRVAAVRAQHPRRARAVVLPAVVEHADELRLEVARPLEKRRRPGGERSAPGDRDVEQGLEVAPRHGGHDAEEVEHLHALEALLGRGRQPHRPVEHLKVRGEIGPERLVRDVEPRMEGPVAPQPAHRVARHDRQGQPAIVARAHVPHPARQGEVLQHADVAVGRLEPVPDAHIDPRAVEARRPGERLAAREPQGDGELQPPAQRQARDELLGDAARLGKAHRPLQLVDDRARSLLAGELGGELQVVGGDVVEEPVGEGGIGPAPRAAPPPAAEPLGPDRLAQALAVGFGRLGQGLDGRHLDGRDRDPAAVDRHVGPGVVPGLSARARVRPRQRRLDGAPHPRGLLVGQARLQRLARPGIALGDEPREHAGGGVPRRDGARGEPRDARLAQHRVVEPRARLVGRRADRLRAVPQRAQHDGAGARIVAQRAQMLHDRRAPGRRHARHQRLGAVEACGQKPAPPQERREAAGGGMGVVVGVAVEHVEQIVLARPHRVGERDEATARDVAVLADEPLVRAPGGPFGVRDLAHVDAQGGVGGRRSGPGVVERGGGGEKAHVAGDHGRIERIAEADRVPPRLLGLGLLAVGVGGGADIQRVGGGLALGLEGGQHGLVLALAQHVARGRLAEARLELRQAPQVGERGAVGRIVPARPVHRLRRHLAQPPVRALGGLGHVVGDPAPFARDRVLDAREDAHADRSLPPVAPPRAVASRRAILASRCRAASRLASLVRSHRPRQRAMPGRRDAIVPGDQHASARPGSRADTRVQLFREYRLACLTKLTQFVTGAVNHKLVRAPKRGPFA